MSFNRIIAINLFLYAIIILCSFMPNNMTNPKQLELLIKDIRSQKGQLYVSIYNAEDDFPADKGGFFTKVVELQGGKSQKITISTLLEGSYAIAVFHDLNSNSKLDANWLGIPTEPYGFSRNFKPVFTAPSFNDVKVEFKKEEQMRQLEITLLH